MEVNKYVIRRSNPDVSWSIPCSGATNMWPINYSTNCSGSTMYSSTASQVLNALNGNMNNFPMELSDCSPTNPCVILWDVNPQPIGTVGRCQVNDFAYIENSPLAAPTEKRPVYTRTSDTTIKTFPSATITSNVTHNYIAKPTKAEWAYVVVNEKALFNGNEAVHFELHASEEESLVINILELSGITINKAGLAQTAANMDQKNIQQEKQ